MKKKIVRLTESQFRKIIENVILKEQDRSHKIIYIERPTENINVEREFKMYKYAIQEHKPIKLSNGNWLHIYRVTKYDSGLHGDPDEEQAAYEKEMY